MRAGTCVHLNRMCEASITKKKHTRAVLLFTGMQATCTNYILRDYSNQYFILLWNSSSFLHIMVNINESLTDRVAFRNYCITLRETSNEYSQRSLSITYDKPVPKIKETWRVLWEEMVVSWGKTKDLRVWCDCWVHLISYKSCDNHESRRYQWTHYNDLNFNHFASNTRNLFVDRVLSTQYRIILVSLYHHH